MIYFITFVVLKTLYNISNIWKSVKRYITIRVNPFHDTGVFLYPMKTSENQRFSDVFRGYRKRLVAWNRLMYFQKHQMLLCYFLSYWEKNLPSFLKIRFYWEWVCLTCLRIRYNSGAMTDRMEYKRFSYKYHIIENKVLQLLL